MCNFYMFVEGEDEFEWKRVARVSQSTMIGLEMRGKAPGKKVSILQFDPESLKGATGERARDRSV